MQKVTTGCVTNPVAEVDSEVLAFRAGFEERSPLDQIVHDGAQRMLQAAIESEVDEFLVAHQGRRDDNGNRWVVRNGSKPTREILTGAGRNSVETSLRMRTLR